MGEEILEIRGLKKRYESGFVLDISSLKIEENKVLVLMGPNGSGKSTLIRLINILEKPDSGDIIFKGRNILKKDNDSNILRKDMAVVFQEPLLFNASVYSNILMGLGFRKISIKDKTQLLEYLIEHLKLKNLLRRNPKSLSSGERQRVSLARALILEPSLLLLDEPLANIDQASRESIRKDLFEILKDIGRSAVYVTHDRNEAMIAADNIAVINEGRIEQYGLKEEVFRKPSNEFTARFVGVDTILKAKVVSSFENLIKISVKNTDNSTSFLYVTAKNIQNPEVIVAIRAEDVILYKEEIDSKKTSAMNLFKGVVTDITDIGIYKKVEIDCGFKLCSFVSSNSVERLKIGLGKAIYASIKASAIHLFTI